MNSQQIHMLSANAELLAKLIARNARVITVGSTATKFHLPHRQADDLDLLIDLTPANAAAVIDAVIDAWNASGFQSPQIDAALLTKPNAQWPIKGYYYADIITPKNSVEFEDAWANAIECRVAHSLSLLTVRIAGRSTLIAMLQKSQELKHQEDVKLLAAASDLQGEKT